MPRAYKYHTVLLIDDNYIDNAIHQRILQNNYFAEKVLCFDSAGAGINYLTDNLQNKSGLPEIIFLDLRMPEVDGYAFLEEIKDMPQASLDLIKIYILSSSLDPADLKRIKKNKLTKGFINKPLTDLILDKL